MGKNHTKIEEWPGDAPSLIAEELRVLYTAVETERQAVRQNGRFNPLPLLVGADIRAVDPGDVEEIVAAVVKRPVETAARQRARFLGLEQAMIGGMDRMHEVCNAVYDYDPRASSWLDHAWDGLRSPCGGVWWS